MRQWRRDFSGLLSRPISAKSHFLMINWCMEAIPSPFAIRGCGLALECGFLRLSAIWRAKAAVDKLLVEGTPSGQRLQRGSCWQHAGHVYRFAHLMGPGCFSSLWATFLLSLPLPYLLRTSDDCLRRFMFVNIYTDTRNSCVFYRLTESRFLS